MKNKIVILIGNFLLVLLPKKSKKMAVNGMTIIDKKSIGFIDLFMRKSLLKKAEKEQNYNQLSKFHEAYWKKQGVKYFSETDDSFETSFLPECTFLFDLLELKLSMEKHNFHTIVEIGCGNGKVLNYLSSKFPDIKRFVGIDLSQQQVMKNKNTFASNKKLEFIASDGFEWTKTYATENMIFVTSRGVLEYFTQPKLQEFLHHINVLGKTTFVAIEPNGIHHNLKTNKASQPYGYERSFSHNYEILFKTAGFHLWHNTTKDSGLDYYLRYMAADNYTNTSANATVLSKSLAK
ncbi:class I SAM-dependent methyltransferase [Maribacter sp. SA7]|uniref:class I SAM-dependent methyltransferase n=1 Tax=Maribacter zhoushanensis TaxID=3030012 RepID=UPI0023ECE7C0|nr:class I SAM-dependent methyltransferase [Maribacter zhoushanensis]MDF4201852.1 class I SAM-dependent methyltransferase [Maribacter zhoushanensis]